MGRRVQKLAVLLLRQMLGDVHMQGAAAVQVFHIVFPVQFELVYHTQALVLRIVEVGAVHIVPGAHEIAVLLVPFVVLSGQVLPGHELGIEHTLPGAVFSVAHIDGFQEGVHELPVCGVRGYLEAQELGGVRQAVHAHGQVLLFHVDETGPVHIQHIGLQEVLDDLVEGGLVFMNAGCLLGHGVGNVFIQHFLVVHRRLERTVRGNGLPLFHFEIFAGSILDETVQVDGHHAFGTGCNGSRTHRILVRGVIVGIVFQVRQGIAQAAAAGEAVGTVGDVAEKAVPLGPHLGGEIGILLVGIVVPAVGQEGHRLHREGEDVVVALLVEPVHKMLLQPGQRFPLGGASVRETEVSEHAVEIRLVKIADVPEHRLVSPVAGRHVHRMHHLLEAVVDDLGEGAGFAVDFHHLVQALQVILSVVLADEIVQVHQEFRGGHGAHKLGRHGIDQVDEFPAEGFEVRGSDGYSAQLPQSALQEGIHGNGYAVRVAGGAALIVLVQDVGLQVLDILLGQTLAIKCLDLVLHNVAVLLDVVFLVQFVSQRHDILMRDVGVGVEL